jgi:microcystin-dependent protein
MIVGSDLQLPHNHIDATAAHGATGAVVGTTNTQTLTNKTLTSPKLNENVAVTATATEVNLLDGATLTTTELNYVDGVTSAIQTQLNTKAPLESPTFTGTVTLPTGGSGLAPVGSIMMWATATPPTGWLICDGQSTTGYTALAAVVGATVPDLRGRAPIGAGTGTGLTARTLGATLGAESVTLTALQSGIRSHSHDNTVSISGDGAHTHNIKTRKVTSSTHDHDNSDANVGPATAAGSGAFVGTTQTAAALSAGHSHSVSISNASHTATAATDAHENMQPSLVVNFIIKH